MRRLRARRREARESAAAWREEQAGVAEQAMLPLAPVGELEEGELRPVSGGRPRGAVDRSASDWRAYFLTRYRSPLHMLAEVAGRPTLQLAEELGCTLLEAMQLQMKAAAELAPYLHSKAPVALQVDGQAVAPVVVAITPAMATRLGMPSGTMHEVVEEQGPGDGPEAPV